MKGKTKYGIKNNNGITLIALVVTIIVLIILAGISINLVLGENGIIQKAKQSKVAQTEAEVKEKVEMMLAEYAMEREFNNKTLVAFLEENNQIDAVTDNEDGTYTIEIDGFAVTINTQKLSITEVGKAGVRPIVSNMKITTDGVAEVTDKVVAGTPLTINFEHSINGGTTTVDKTLPYTTNGTETEVTFVVTGTVNGESYTKTVFVSLEDKYKIPQIVIGEIKITNAEGEEVADEGVVEGTPLKINFANSIEGGTTVVKLGGTAVTLPYTTNGTDTEFNFIVVGTVNGIDYEEDVNVSLISKYRKPLIAEAVQIGDFVNYSLGNWTEQDIAKLGSLYTGTSNPTSHGKFGGFGTGSSKDSDGWRVLSKNSDGSVNIIYASSTEAYYNQVLKAAESETILRTTRDWSMYEDCSTDSASTNYAVKGSAHCMRKDELDSYGSGSVVAAIGKQYWLATAGGTTIYHVRPDGYGNTDGNNHCYGVRPIVTLKAEVKATSNPGDTIHTTKETAWNLSM